MQKRPNSERSTLSVQQGARATDPERPWLILNVGQNKITMTPSIELQAKLHACDPEIQEYVLALQKAYKQLESEAIKLKTKRMINESRIAALEKDLRDRTEPFTTIGSESIKGHLTHEAVLKSLNSFPESNDKE